MIRSYRLDGTARSTYYLDMSTVVLTDGRCFEFYCRFRAHTFAASHPGAIMLPF